MFKKKTSSLSVAQNNIKNGFSTPLAKVSAVGIAVAVLVFGGIAVKSFNGGKAGGAGAAKAADYSVNNANVDGEITDVETIGVLEEKINQDSAAALSNGGSNLGAFIFESNKVPQLNIQDTFHEDGKNQVGPKINAEEVRAALKERAAALDRMANQHPTVSASTATPTSGALPQSQSSQQRQANTFSNISPAYQQELHSGMVDNQGQPRPYGLSPQDFTAIANQLATVGQGTVGYSSMQNGLLNTAQQLQTSASNTNAQQAQRTANNSGSAANDNVVRAGQLSNAPSNGNVKGRLLAEAGSVCAAKSESAINTDFSLPVFFELLSCKELTGVRVRGTVQQTPDDFVISFTDFFPTNQHNFKFTGSPQGVSMNLNNSGYAGVASDVNNHWGTRLLSSALLNLASTEKEFIQQRGTSSITTGTSSTVAINPMTDKEKQEARLAGVLQGSMDVITKDTQYGVNRKPTMTMPLGEVIGIQFLSNIEVVNE